MSAIFCPSVTLVAILSEIFGARLIIRRLWPPRFIRFESAWLFVGDSNMCSLYEHCAVVTGTEVRVWSEVANISTQAVRCVSNIFSKGEASLKVGEHFETLWCSKVGWTAWEIRTLNPDGGTPPPWEDLDEWRRGLSGSVLYQGPVCWR